MTPERLRELLEYDPLSGNVSRRKSKRILSADPYGMVSIYDSETKKNYKSKLDKVAYTLGFGKVPKDDERILHKNMKQDDNRLRNLGLLSRTTYLKVKEAYKNLTGGIRMNPHPIDQFSYVVNWYEKGIEKSRVVEDVVPAKELVLRLNLLASKVLTKYCLFED